jgi:hypothetical protein
LEVSKEGEALLVQKAETRTLLVVMRSLHSIGIVSLFVATLSASAEPVQFSGIYPHLAMFNNEGECGTGAVVPWADKLWVITYGPHLPFGSSDKLYEIDAALTQTIRPESQGGTPANRMIHRESNQLFIGSYAVDGKGGVRVIPWQAMPGRLTGNARHLTDPAGKLFFATMEEALYEVDVKTLEVTGLIKDSNKPKPDRPTAEAHPATVASQLPGYHGKGLYSGQGRVVYANNGDQGKGVLTDPSTPSGALGEWRKPGDDWQLVRRNQFTEVTGPGGIYGNEHPETDPIWSIGWDYRSLILMLLDGGQWTSYRLPKASHSYDGAHGWNTEWPRIRDIGQPDLLMTMHGMFWKFPKTFSVANSAGIAPLSSYLKIVGDFARWNDRIVLGCDDTAQSEFLNKRKVKGDLIGPGQSQSNLWFLKPEQLASFGPAAATGAVWQDDAVQAGAPSDAFLFSGFAQRSLHLAHDAAEPVTFTIETNDGHGDWKPLRKVPIPAHGYQWLTFLPEQTGAWVRIRADHDLAKATADFHYSNADQRTAQAAPIFTGLAAADAKDYSGGVIRTRGEGKKTLSFAAATVRDGKVTEEGYYELDGQAQLRRVKDPGALDFAKKNAAIPRDVISVDAASVLVIDDAGRRWRLPKGDPALEAEGALPLRVDREVSTERDVLHAYGTFYDLPAENAGGFIKMRPIATHHLRITDYCSYRGLLVFAGLAPDAKGDHIVRSDDGKTALWLGAEDDLWALGKPRGEGGPWKDSSVQAGQPSDPYLMTNYDRKSLTLLSDAKEPVVFTVEVDFLGNGNFHEYAKLTTESGKPLQHSFPAGYSAKWIRFTASKATTATAVLHYE